MADRAPLTAALLDALRTTGFEVGDNVAPRPERGQALPKMPYFVLYDIPGGSFDGPYYFDPEADMTAVYQLDAVGERADQVRTLLDRGRSVILGRDDTGAIVVPIEPDGYKVMGTMSDGGPGGVDREGTVFSTAERFVLTVTPL